MRHVLPLLALFVLMPTARAELVSLTFHTREPFAEGKSFGDVGPYERLIGVARFAVDPAHKRNKAIVDLDLAPRNDKGKVEFSADVFILRPTDLTKGNGAILYDVNNRGNKLALRMFNDAPGVNDPKSVADAGNGFLMRRGYTIVWCGWIGELLPGGGRMLLEAPVATDKGKPITGEVRFEMVCDKATNTMPLSRRDGHGSYTLSKKGEREGYLTWRMRQGDNAKGVPRAHWSLERVPIPFAQNGVKGTLPQIRCKLAGGFRPGYIYEFIGECEGPIVQGLGFAAVRDLIAFLKHDNSTDNPLRADKKLAINRAHAFGVSQSGRFLRHLLYEGFNVDEAGRRVFEGVMPHVAGGGLGYFNHRFAQPTRHNGQHEEHYYPCDVFPFTYGDSVNEAHNSRSINPKKHGSLDGILKRLRDEDVKLMPLVMHTQSAAEYWHRAGSLVHTNTLGTKDATIPDNVRIYTFGGTQHGPASRNAERGIADNLHNPADYRPFLRALLDAMDDGAKNGTPPPASVYPRISDGTLSHWNQQGTGFPWIPGVRYPEVIQQPPFRHALGDQLRRSSERDRYGVVVPKSGVDGNDQGCLSPLEVAVPLATYTGWNLRRADAGAEAMLASLLGSYIPFPRTEAERKAASDPRDSIEKRYGNLDTYKKAWKAESERLVKARYLLKEDAEAQAASVEKLWNAAMGKK